MEGSKNNKNMGVHVIEGPSLGDFRLEMAEVPEEALAEMTRRKVKPFVSIDEVESEGKNFCTLGGFAVTFDEDSE